MNKQALRQQIRLRKRAMTEAEILEKSALLGQRLTETEVYRDAKTIYGYLSYNQEVRTLPILARALRDGKRVAVPKLYGDTMKFLYLDDLTQIAENNLGIPEPIADAPEADDPTALVLMPGLAFDPEGRRIGYGGGFYDRFLQREPTHPTIALCYSFQVFPKLETEDFDIPADIVIWA